MMRSNSNASQKGSAREAAIGGTRGSVSSPSPPAVPSRTNRGSVTGSNARDAIIGTSNPHRGSVSSSNPPPPNFSSPSFSAPNVNTSEPKNVQNGSQSNAASIGDGSLRSVGRSRAVSGAPPSAEYKKACKEFKPQKWRKNVCSECFFFQEHHQNAKSALEEALSDCSLNNQDPTEVFELIDIIGAGAYGSVFLGRAIVSDELYAIKFLELDGKQDKDAEILAVVNEINIMKESTSCPFVVEYQGCFVKDSVIMMVMEYCSCSVEDILSYCPEVHFSETQIAAVCAAIIKGLSFLHAYGITHRDIKSGNILLKETGEVKLADFGVSRKMKNDRDKMKTLAGSPYWCAPELITADSYDNRVDIWACGIVALEMAEGRPPHWEMQPLEVIFHIPKQPSPKVKDASKWSPDFLDFLDKCLKKNPAERASAKELLYHPFILAGSSQQILVPLIEKSLPVVMPRKKAELKEEQDDDAVDAYKGTMLSVDKTTYTADIVTHTDPKVEQAITTRMQRLTVLHQQQLEEKQQQEAELAAAREESQNKPEKSLGNSSSSNGSKDSSSPSGRKSESSLASFTGSLRASFSSGNSSEPGTGSGRSSIFGIFGIGGSGNEPGSPTSPPTKIEKQSQTIAVPRTTSQNNASGREASGSFSNLSLNLFKKNPFGSLRGGNVPVAPQVPARFFGIPLEDSLAGCQIEGTPHIIDDLFNYLISNALEIEGIFRISGDVLKISELKKKYKEGAEVDLSQYNPHVVAGVLKLYFRELPEPLLTTGLYDQFLKAQMAGSEEERVEKIRTLIEVLPGPNQQTLQKLIVFLATVASRSEESKMTSANLSRCFAPNLLFRRDETPESLLNDSPVVNGLIETMIDKYQLIWK